MCASYDLFVMMLVEQPATGLIVAVALLGAVVGAALGQATRFSQRPSVHNCPPAVVLLFDLR
jgi:hypothetical protein